MSLFFIGILKDDTKAEGKHLTWVAKYPYPAIVFVVIGDTTQPKCCMSVQSQNAVILKLILNLVFEEDGVYNGSPCPHRAKSGIDRDIYYVRSICVSRLH